jgi:hypothetical protein
MRISYKAESVPSAEHAVRIGFSWAYGCLAAMAEVEKK